MRDDMLYVLMCKIGVKVIVPLNYVDKLKSHPALSFQKSIDNVCWSADIVRLEILTRSKDLLKEYSGVGGLDTVGVNTLHTKFNPTLCMFESCLQ